MGQSCVKICGMMLASLAFAATGFAVESSPDGGASTALPKVKHAKTHEKITLGIGGADDKRSAEMLTSALNAHGLKGSLHKGSSSEMTTSVEPTSDLSIYAKALAEVSTPQKATAPPTLSVVVFALLTKESEQKV